MSKYKFGIIGSGNMGFAVAKGCIEKGVFPQDNVVFFDTNEDRLEELRNLGYMVSENLFVLYETCETILVAVKPQVMKDVLAMIEDSKATPLIISVAAGITTEYMKKHVATDNIIRVMPNTPLLIGIGATAICKSQYTDASYLKIAEEIFSSIGITVTFDDEDMLNKVIPINGSAPAYVYYYMNAMINHSVTQGISYDDAKKLAVQTFIGSAEMVGATDRKLEELIADVCSPGGTTLEAMRVFDERDITGIIAEANEKCIARSYELAEEFQK